MSIMPEWLIERLKATRPGPAPVEPEVIEPEIIPSYYLAVSCPDPECPGTDQVPRHLVLADDWIVTGHLVRPGDRERCWMSGMHIRDAKAIIALREENGGRLRMAAHP